MAEFDADAFADSLPGWDPEARAAFLASLDDDDAPELPLLAESVDEMDPAMVEALMQLRDGGEPPSELAVDAKERGDAQCINRDLHAIDATPARWRGGVVSHRSIQPARPRSRRERDLTSTDLDST